MSVERYSRCFWTARSTCWGSSTTTSRRFFLPPLSSWLYPTEALPKTTIAGAMAGPPTSSRPQKLERENTAAFRGRATPMHAFKAPTTATPAMAKPIWHRTRDAEELVRTVERSEYVAAGARLPHKVKQKGQTPNQAA